AEDFLRRGAPRQHVEDILNANAHAANGRTAAVLLAVDSDAGQEIAHAPHPITVRSAAELLVLDALGNDAVRAQAAHLILLEGFEVALETLHMAVAFEGEDVGGQTIQEPAVVDDNHSAADELFQSLFEVLQGFDV